jgi:hypothetical protein
MHEKYLALRAKQGQMVMSRLFDDCRLMLLKINSAAKPLTLIPSNSGVYGNFNFKGKSA